MSKSSVIPWRCPGQRMDRRRSRSPPNFRNDHIREKLDKIEARRKEESSDAVMEWGSSKKERKAPQENRDYGPTTSFNRYADDPALNSEQKKDVRWDDPARYFVEELKPTVQKYRIQPNRFGIQPGKEWDGVDRSNGFEVKLFQKRASRGVMRDLEHNYSVRDY